MKVLVVDDEAPARLRLRTLLEEVPDVECVRECADGAGAVAAIRDHAPDVVMLDVRIPELDGFEVIRTVGDERMPLVIFVTAYAQYATRAFEVGALDYLLKPFADERLHAALDRVRRRLERMRGPSLRRKLQAMITQAQAGSAFDRLLVHDHNRTIVVPTREIGWIETDGEHVHIHTDGGGYRVPGGLPELEERLDPAVFVRVHRGAVVNVRRVVEIRKLAAHESVVLADGTELAIGDGCRDVLLERFGAAR